MTVQNQFGDIMYHEFHDNEFVICSTNEKKKVLFYFCSQNNILTLNMASIDEETGLIVSEIEECKTDSMSNKFFDKKHRILYVNNRKQIYHLDALYRPIKIVHFTGEEESRAYDSNNNITFIKLKENLWVKRAFDDNREIITYEDSSGNWWDKEAMPEIPKNPYIKKQSYVS